MDYGLNILQNYSGYFARGALNPQTRGRNERTWRINLLIATRILRKGQREILFYDQPYNMYPLVF